MANLPTAGAGMISVADAEILLSNVDQRYMDMYNQISGSELINWVEGLFETYPMSMDTLRLPWQEVMDGFREWEGADKFFEGLIVRDMTVKTRPFEKSLQIDRRCCPLSTIRSKNDRANPIQNLGEGRENFSNS